MKVNLLLRKVLLIGIVNTGFIVNLVAQEAITASGAHTTNTSGSLSYSIGQVFYMSASGINGYVTQGVQQPYEISFPSGIHLKNEISFKCSVYPNPTSDYLILSIEDLDKNKLSYNLINSNGMVLEIKKLMSDETKIDMGHRAPGTYFLKVLESQNPGSFYEIIVFQIIKN